MPGLRRAGGARRGTSHLWSAIILVLMLTVAAPAQAQTPAPTITAGAAILVDLTADRIIAGEQIHERRAVASLTKVMTAVVALRYGQMSDETVVRGQDLPGEASIGLRTGERVSLETLLYGMLMRSGNDAATVLARAVGDRVAAERGLTTDGLALFIGLMNEQATEYGLQNTNFVNPHGLDAPDHYSSAYDLAVLTREAMRDERFARAFEARSYRHGGALWTNVNRLLYEYEGLIGGKTGVENNSGLCLVEVAQRDGRRLLVIVLNAPQWYADARAWLDYGYSDAAPLAANLPRFSQPAPSPTLSVSPAAATVPARPAATATPGQREVSAGGGPLSVPTPSQSRAAAPAPVAEPDWALLTQIGLGVLAVVLAVGLVSLVLRLRGRGPWARTGWAHLDRRPQAPWRSVPLDRGSGARGGDGFVRRREVEPEMDAEPEWDDLPPEEEEPEFEPEPAPPPATPRRRPLPPHLPPVQAVISFRDVTRQALDEIESPQVRDNVLRHVTVAANHVADNRLGSAANMLEKAVVLAPHFRFSALPEFWRMGPAGFVVLAYAYERNNRLAEARAAITVGLVSYPNDPDLQQLDRQMREEQRAEDERLLADDPDHAPE